MRYIYTNSSDFAKIEKYLNSKEYEYSIELNAMNIYLPNDGDDFTLIIQYLDISHI